MPLKKIRLELARDLDYPEGSNERGYEFVAPLTPDDHLDAAAWKTHRQQCTIRRFWKGDIDAHGLLVHKPGGSWAFHYDDPDAADDEESGYRFSQHLIRIGEYVSIREHKDHMRTYRVVSVTGI